MDLDKYHSTVVILP